MLYCDIVNVSYIMHIYINIYKPQNQRYCKHKIQATKPNIGMCLSRGRPGMEGN